MTNRQRAKMEEVTYGDIVGTYRYVAYEDDQDRIMRVWDVEEHKPVALDSPNHLETRDWGIMSAHLRDLNTFIYFESS